MSYFRTDSPLRPQSGRSAPLSRERRKASQMRRVSPNKNTALFHSYYLNHRSTVNYLLSDCTPSLEGAKAEK